MKIQNILLSENEENQIIKLAQSIINDTQKNNGTTECNILQQIQTKCALLPFSIQEKFFLMKRFDEYDVTLIKTNIIKNMDCGNTPQEYLELQDDYQLNIYQIIHGLFMCLLGTPIGFHSQRNGKCFTNIIPIKSIENIPNSSSGSNFKFDFHTEDAFHPFMADYIGLVCMRNNERAKTTVSSIRDIELTEKEKEILFSKDFQISFNYIHSSHAKEFEKTSILFGDFNNPFLRINFANLQKIQQEQISVINSLKEKIEKNTEIFILEKGDFIYIDNFYCVHARDVYIPNYGDNARWLTRLVSTRDIRKSITMRSNIKSHILL